jgi:hypothetical protein
LPFGIRDRPDPERLQTWLSERPVLTRHCTMRTTFQSIVGCSQTRHQGVDFDDGECAVDIHVRRFRAKLPPQTAAMLETRRGVGYGLTGPGRNARA